MLLVISQILPPKTNNNHEIGILVKYHNMLVFILIKINNILAKEINRTQILEILKLSDLKEGEKGIIGSRNGGSNTDKRYRSG